MPGKLVNDRGAENGAAAGGAPPPAAPSFPLEDLAWQCAKNAVAVSQYLSAHNLPQPSHDADGPSSTLPKDAPDNVKRARQALMSAALQLFQLAAGPSEFVPNLAPGVQYVACLSWLLRYDIFHLVPLSGTISYSELAEAASKRADASATVTIPVRRLKGIVRMAMTSGLFREPAPDRVAHSATSALLARDADVAAWAAYVCNRSAPTALAMTAAHDRFTPASVAKDQTAYNVAFATDLPFFDHLALNPAHTAEFAGYMRNVTTSDALDVKHLVRGYADGWAALSAAAGGAQIVDVGGSTGNADIALTRAYPGLRCIVQDLPDNADAGRRAAEALPADIRARLTFQAHDFTKPQPVAGADVYLLRMILHDWPDHVAVNILRNLVPVLARQRASGTAHQAKLLIMDTVLPGPGRVPASVERIVRVRDLTMMQVFNSHERDLDQWTALLAAADADLRIVRVINPFGSAMALLEVELDRDADDKAEPVAEQNGVAHQFEVPELVLPEDTHRDGLIGLNGHVFG